MDTASARVDESAAPDLRSALLGAWWVERRRSNAYARFLRLTFYRDGRFRTLAADARTIAYGNWSVLEPARNADALAGLLTLRFDGYGVPSVEYGLRMAAPPQGPIEFTEREGDRRTIELFRPGAVDAALIGNWHARGRDASARGVVMGIEMLQLRRDGLYVGRFADREVHLGLWSFEPGDIARALPRTGLLLLDPHDLARPIARWPATLETGAHPALSITVDGAVVAMVRQSLGALDRCFVAHWRFVGPSDAPVAHELTLRGDGTATVLVRSGAPTITGSWRMLACERASDAVEGTLALTLPTGRSLTQERWYARLPFAPNAELSLQREKATLRYRKLFR